MTHFKTSNGEFLAVEVPHDATKISVDGDTLRYNRCGNNPFMRTIPPNTYTIIRIAKDLTEVECAGIVGDIPEGGFMIDETRILSSDYATSHKQALTSTLRARAIPLSSLILKVG